MANLAPYPSRSIRDERYKLIWNMSARRTGSRTSSPSRTATASTSRGGSAGRPMPGRGSCYERYQHRPELEFFDLSGGPARAGEPGGGAGAPGSGSRGCWFNVAGMDGGPGGPGAAERRWRRRSISRDRGRGAANPNRNRRFAPDAGETPAFPGAGPPPTQRLLLRVLQLVQPPVDAPEVEELVVGAVLADGAVVENVDAVDVLDRRQAVGDDDRGLALHQVVQGVLGQGLGLGVDAGGRFVEEQELRFAGQGAGRRRATAVGRSRS